MLFFAIKAQVILRHYSKCDCKDNKKFLALSRILLWLLTKKGAASGTFFNFSISRRAF